jgi:magnesium-transporting ATPase (P-type)
LIASTAVEAPYRSAVSDVMSAVAVDPRRGLTQAEADARLARHGPNELSVEKPVSAWKRLLGQFRGPLTLLLLVATAVSLLVWTIERESPLPYEALTILAVLLLNASSRRPTRRCFATANAAACRPPFSFPATSYCSRRVGRCPRTRASSRRLHCRPWSRR